MKLLLDANVLLWWLSESSRLSKSAREAIIASDLTYVSAATAWEIAIKVALGKLEFRGEMEAQLTLNHFRPLPVTVAHAVTAARLPRHHADPFDRMLVAQASLESLVLLTSDERLAAYGVAVLMA